MNTLKALIVATFVLCASAANAIQTTFTTLFNPHDLTAAWIGAYTWGVTSSMAFSVVIGNCPNVDDCTYDDPIQICGS